MAISNVSVINLGNNGANVRPYGTCSTTETTANKFVAVPSEDFQLFPGASIIVLFSYANTAISPTLTINGTPRKYIKFSGSYLTDPLYYSWPANSLIEFVYDGEAWNLMTTQNVASTSGSGSDYILPAATDTTLGGIKVGTVNTDAVTEATEGSNYYPVNIDSTGLGYVALPSFTTNTGTITRVSAGNGLTSTGTFAVTLNVGAGTGISVAADTVNLKSAATNEIGGIKVSTERTTEITKATEGSNYYPVNIDSTGLGYVALPSFTNASTITINTSSSDYYYPMTFVPTNSAGNTSLYIDSSTSFNSTSEGIRYNPYYNRCYCSGGFYEASDERLKNFGDDIEVDLNKLSQLSKKYFTWKDDKSSVQQIGVSAQEIQKLYPELVNAIDEEGHLSVSYDKLSIIALKGIDVLNDKIKSFEERLERLEKLIEK